MVRKLSLAIALALGVTPLAVYSLGLGDIKTRSGLNQKFQADIELLSVESEEMGDIRASLASEEAFAEAGVNRPYFLSQLKFKPIRLPNGESIIRVTSGDPVREPFLNFLIELNWPNGRIFREFTVLLDPPVTLQRRVVPVQAATVSGKQTARRGSPSGSDRSAAVGSGGISEYGPTRRNDTLWKIASEVRHSGTSMEQMMMAMFQANPQAFIKRNINNLKIGEILRVPERDVVLSMTASEARIAFRDQLENWRADRAEPALAQPAGGMETAAAEAEAAGQDGAETSVAAEEEAGAEPEAELKIARMQTAEEAGKSIADSTDIKQSSTSLKEDLLDAREMRESALEETKELKGRVESLASQLEDLQRLLELKDEQLARLQAALGDEPALPAGPETETATATDTKLAPTALEEAVESQVDTAAAGEEAVDPNLTGVDGETIEVEVPSFESLAQNDAALADAGDEAVSQQAPALDEDTAETPQTVEAEVVAKSETTPPAVEDKAEITQSPAVVPVPVQEPAAGFMEKLTSHPLLKKLTSDPTLIAIGGGVVAVLLGLIWLLTGRRRNQGQDFQESILTDTIVEKEGVAAAAIEQAESVEPESSNTEETSFLSDFSPSEIDALPEETGDVDPLAEADVYIAYGRFGQAEELVRQGLERNPRSQELKLKLFEILYATKNVAAFTALAEGVKADGWPKTDPGAWESVTTMGAKLAPGSSLFAAGVATLESESRDEIGDLGDLDLGDLAASLDLDDVSKGEQAGQTSVDSDEKKSSSPRTNTQNDDGLTLSLSGEEGNSAVDMDDLGGDLASLDAGLDLDLETVEGDSLDLKNIAGDVINPVELEDVSLDLPSVEPESSADEPGLSIEGLDSIALDTEEVERLELPDVDELPAENLGDMAADAYSSDEIDTKLDLARAYLEMGDEEGARSILQEVVNEGSDQQKQVAQKIIGGFS